jgi:hypothetical protein
MVHPLPILAAAILLGASAASAQSTAAGRIKVATGAVRVVHTGSEFAARPGRLVYQGDLIRTGRDGRLGLTLGDDTRLSLGPDSELRLDRFSYAPESGQLALAIKLIRGIAAYVSGRIAKLAPDAVRIETPTAILGVRGTTLAIRAGGA